MCLYHIQVTQALSVVQSIFLECCQILADEYPTRYSLMKSLFTIADMINWHNTIFEGVENVRIAIELEHLYILPKGKCVVCHDCRRHNWALIFWHPKWCNRCCSHMPLTNYHCRSNVQDISNTMAQHHIMAVMFVLISTNIFKSIDRCHSGRLRCLPQSFWFDALWYLALEYGEWVCA